LFRTSGALQTLNAVNVGVLKGHHTCGKHRQ
jgi:hypothetical protein